MNDPSSSPALSQLPSETNREVRPTSPLERPGSTRCDSQRLKGRLSDDTLRCELTTRRLLSLSRETPGVVAREWCKQLMLRIA